MPFTSDSERKIAFKKILGKSHTDNAKDPGNEALSSFVQMSASSVMGEVLNSTPNNSALYSITAGNVEFVRLVLTPDPSSNGHAYIASLPADYETNSSNPKAGTGVFVNGQVLANTAGALQIVPALYGLNYEAKPYRGGTGSQGSGSLVPPGDAVDWYLDTATGIVFQENDPAAGPADMTYLECFIYIGDMLSDSISTAINDLPMTESENLDIDTGAPELVAQVSQADARVVKWLFEARSEDALRSYACEITAASLGSVVNHQVSNIMTFGNPASSFMQVDVELVSNNMRLVATTDETNVEAQVTQIVVR